MRGTPKLSVLVVDDAEDTRELLAEYLMQAGYHSIMAANGGDALKRLAAIKPDVIVSDLRMPDMNGGELVRRVRANPDTSAIPIILLSGSGKEKALQELGEHVRDVSAIFLKPVRLADLQRAIEAALSAAP